MSRKERQLTERQDGVINALTRYAQKKQYRLGVGRLIGEYINGLEPAIWEGDMSEIIEWGKRYLDQRSKGIK